MTRILSSSILFLAGWFYIHSPQVAQPTPVRVRLFSIEQPSEIRVTAGDGQTVVIDAQLTPASVQLEVVVQTDTPIVETEKTQQADTITAER